MIKVMIVDDMPIFLEYLRTTIDWETYGFELVCEATNGEEALLKAENCQPDIVLSDIKMPYMDGLLLTEKLSELHPEISVVLITGNSEFEYARRAIKLGVVDYIVKPFEKEELILTLLSLQDNINQAIELKQEKKDELYLKRESLLRELIYSKELSSNLEGNLYLASLDINQENYYYAMTVEVEAERRVHSDSEMAMNWKSMLAPLYNDYMGKELTRYYFTDYEGRIVFIIPVQQDKPQSIDEDEIKYFMRFVQERIHLDITVGIGGIHNGLAGIRKSYLESVNALSHRYQDGANSIFSYESITTEEKTYGFYSAEINEIILNHLHQRNATHTLEIIESVFMEADLKRFSDTYKRMINMSIVSLLLSYLVKAGRNIEDVYPEEFDPYHVINSQNDEEQRRFIKVVYAKAFAYLDAHSESRTCQVAREAQKYIELYYNNPHFNINDVSKHLLVNQTYLRKMFKEEMGTTISEYLTKVRMESAKQLITEGQYKLSAISEMVGYNDPGYFSKCFKNYYGVSPREYQ
ncbi:response regulator [Fusibacter bizertensis]|uniref:Stage 0 sporulation protein A homolog n=1 Tax=Fusibacter bizertensis TaxID=1488331 RepID=A0ABT6N8S0_9FIRM|nr:response regulator [Fusibacter bizertensis]MDH8676809.1 response regulator [Fusibacter bizertensis]